MSLLPVEDALAQILKGGNYDGYVSIEMKNLNDLQIVKDAISYIK